MARDDSYDNPIADALVRLSRAIDRLGTGDAVTTMGAIEFHGAMVKEGAEKIAAGLHDIASAIRESHGI